MLTATEITEKLDMVKNIVKYIPIIPASKYLLYSTNLYREPSKDDTDPPTVVVMTVIGVPFDRYEQETIYHRRPLAMCVDVLVYGNQEPILTQDGIGMDFEGYVYIYNFEDILGIDINYTYFTDPTTNGNIDWLPLYGTMLVADSNLSNRIQP